MRPRTAVAPVTALVALVAASAVAQEPPVAEEPPVEQPPTEAVVPNVCDDPAAALRCPDLVMAPPARFVVRESRKGRLLLLAENRIVNIGHGPLEVRGKRGESNREMDAYQVIRRWDERPALLRPQAGELYFKFVDRRRGSYWKYDRAARFELWRMGPDGERTTLRRTGPKLVYCFRDLRRVRTFARSPRMRRFGACNQRGTLRQARLGTSPGWADIYPPSYPENYIDITGLQGCYAFVHRADPDNRLAEEREDNNVGVRIIRLPPRSGRVRARGCP